jgi:hypothetical protein
LSRQETWTAAQAREYFATGRAPGAASPEVAKTKHPPLDNPPAEGVSEFDLQREVVSWIRAHVDPADCQVLHVPMGGRSAMDRLYDAAKGAVAGTPDLLLMRAGGVGGWIELKRPDGGRQSEAQRAFEQSLPTGWRYWIARSIDDARAALAELGVPVREGSR